MKVLLQEAASLIKNDKIVAVPSETVYGLAANALSDNACREIYRIKNRPTNNPLIVHVSGYEQASELAYFDELAKNLVNKFWPGPLTIVLKSKNKISKIASNFGDTIALRAPDHEDFLNLIKLSKVPIAAPSANLSTRISPTTPEHVAKNFPNLPIIYSKAGSYGIESAIIDLSAGKPKILRHGFITQDLIEKELGESIFPYPSTIENVDSENSAVFKNLKAPGMLKKHYSPRCPIRINAKYAAKNEIAINFGDSDIGGAEQFNLSKSANLAEAASKLYTILYKSEEKVLIGSLKSIVVAPVPNQGIGIAINDKLIRASYK